MMVSPIMRPLYPLHKRWNRLYSGPKKGTSYHLINLPVCRSWIHEGRRIWLVHRRPFWLSFQTPLALHLGPLKGLKITSFLFNSRCEYAWWRTILLGETVRYCGQGWFMHLGCGNRHGWRKDRKRAGYVRFFEGIRDLLRATEMLASMAFRV